jgi:hypothetical protein
VSSQHIVEDFLAEWSSLLSHVRPLTTWLRGVHAARTEVQRSLSAGMEWGAAVSAAFDHLTSLEVARDEARQRESKARLAGLRIGAVYRSLDESAMRPLVQATRANESVEVGGGAPGGVDADAITPDDIFSINLRVAENTHLILRGAVATRFDDEWSFALPLRDSVNLKRGLANALLEIWQEQGSVQKVRGLALKLSARYPHLPVLHAVYEFVEDAPTATRPVKATLVVHRRSSADAAWERASFPWSDIKHALQRLLMSA